MSTKEKASVLELNGKPYDARTGLLITNHPQHHKQHRSIDGFISPAHQAAPSVAYVPKPPSTDYKAVTSHVPVHSLHKAIDIQRPSAHPAAHHRPQHAVTLMRHSVQRPSDTIKRRTKVTSNTGALITSPSFDVIPKLSISEIDKDRLKRAEHVAKSKLIKRFGQLTSDATSLLPISQPAVTEQAKMPDAEQPAPSVSPTPRQASADIFERAMAQANSHREPPYKHKKAHRKGHGRRLASFGVSSLAILLILGFVAYQNTAMIEVHIAAAKSGINATLPSYQPSGFAFSKLTFKPGTVAVNYDNVTNKKDFSIVQTASHWSSSTELFNNYVYPNSSTYEAVKAAGKIIYTYNDNAATWISSGIWYKVVSDGSLSTSQLINIAVSM